MEFTGERMIPEFNEGREIYLEHMNRYFFATQYAQGKVVVDIACGSGYGSNLLIKNGAKKVFGIDISKDSIEYCKSKYKSKNLKFIVGDVRKIPIKDNSIDLIVSYETIEHVSEEDQLLFMNEIQRILKKDGILIMSTPNVKRSMHDNQYHLKELTFNEYKKLISDKFKNNIFLYQDNIVSNYIFDQKTSKESDCNKNIEINVNKLCGLDPEDCLFFISISSNHEIKKPKNNLSLLNFKERNELIGYIQELEKALRDKDKIVNNSEKLINEKDKIIKHAEKLVTERDEYIKRLEKKRK